MARALILGAGGQDGRILTDIFFSKGVEVHAIPLI